MWKSKKVVLIAALAIAVLVGCIAGVTFAQTGNGNDTQPQAKYEALLDRVSQIYQQNTGVTIDAQQLKDAFTQAQTDMQTEALKSWLQNMVSEGKITQEQADQYLQWWQSKPNIQMPGPCGGGEGMMWGRSHDCWNGGPPTTPETPSSNPPESFISYHVGDVYRQAGKVGAIRREAVSSNVKGGGRASPLSPPIKMKHPTATGGASFFPQKLIITVEQPLLCSQE